MVYYKLNTFRLWIPRRGFGDKQHTMSGFQSWLQQLEYGKALELLIVVVSALLCTTIHEVSHGYAAYRLGDPTAKRAGRLSLNPLRHIDLLGLLCMALVHFGWAKPVPINPGYFKHFRRDTAVVSLAGPLSNFILAFVAMTLYTASWWLWRYLGTPEWAWYLALFFWYTAILSCTLGLFNLIPVPPLDGSKILFSLLPEEKYRWLLRYERYGFLLMAVLLVTNILDKPMAFLQDKMLDVLFWACSWPIDLLNHLFL